MLILPGIYGPFNSFRRILLSDTPQPGTKFPYFCRSWHLMKPENLFEKLYRSDRGSGS